MSEPDRASILRRRAFFVGSALSALTACPRAEKAESRPQPVVGVETESSGTLPDPSGKSVAPASNPSPAKIPSLEIPAGVGKHVRAEYERLESNVKSIHGELDAASTELHAICDIGDSRCDDKWLSVAKHLAVADDVVTDLDPMCPGSSEDAKEFMKRLRVHKRFIDGRQADILKRAQTKLTSDDARAKWKVYRESSTMPRPCLDFSCNEW